MDHALRFAEFYECYCDECVAVGMLPLEADAVAASLELLAEKMESPTLH